MKSRTASRRMVISSVLFFFQALRLKPNSAVAHYLYARVLADTGILTRHTRTSSTPLSLIHSPSNIGRACPILFLSRLYDEAIAEYRKLIVIAPEFPRRNASWGWPTSKMSVSGCLHSITENV